MNFLKKIASMFKSKKFVSWLAVGIASIVVVSSVLGIMLPSYFSWKNYYDAIIGEREHQKYLQTLPLECTGLSAELSDSVTYYANGRARPRAEDFNVTAHFTEKGNSFDEILLPGAFTISYGNDFSQNGGSVTVKYLFQPEEEDKETSGDESNSPSEKPTVEPKEFTAQVDCALETVVPVSIKRTALPYRITYSDEMTFDKEGMQAQVTFNDGSTETVGGKEFTVGDSVLSLDTKEVSVAWERGGTRFDFVCPITVVSAAQYDDGYVTAVEPAGRVYVEAGSNTSDAVIPVRGTYENGNRLLLPGNMYTVSGNTATATFTKKCILSVFLKDDPSIFCKTAAMVKSGIEAENAEYAANVTADVDEYELSAGEYVFVGETKVVAPVNGTQIRFNINCDSVAKPEFSVRLAMKPSAKNDNEETEQPAVRNAESIKLSDVIIMRVNDITVRLPESLVLERAYGAEDKYVFKDFVFPSPILQKKTNRIQMFFTGENAGKIVVDRVELETGYTGTFYASSEAYLVANSTSDVAAEYDYTVIKPFGSVAGMAYGHSICSDGTYLYMLGTNWSSANRTARVAKYDPATNSEVAVSKLTEEAVQEYCAGITYYDHKIIIYYTDGRKMYVDVENFVNDCEFKEYDGFKFEGLKEQTEDEEGNITQAADVIKDVYYNSAKSRFAVYSGDKLYLYNKDMTKIKELVLHKETAVGGSPRRVSGSADYIYASYTKDGQYSPIVHIYDWEGEHIGKVTVPITESFLSSNGVVLPAKTNIQALAVINGDFYATLLRFGQGQTGYGDASMFVKITMPEISEKLEPDLKLNEYINQCAAENVTPKFVASPSLPQYGTVEKTSGYAMGGVFDGQYLYIANNANQNASAKISKVDITDYSVVAQSALTSFSGTAETADNSRLFIKDGRLYMTSGAVYSIALDEFAENCVLQKDEEMTALLSMGGNYEVKSAQWNEQDKKYAVLTYDAKLLILNENGSLKEMRTPALGNAKVSSICGDGEYIYLSFTANNLKTTTVEVYRWDGSKANVFGIERVNLGGANFNVQAIYIVNGDLHLSVCSWDNGHIVFHDWTVKGDTNVFP